MKKGLLSISLLFVIITVMGCGINNDNNTSNSSITASPSALSANAEAKDLVIVGQEIAASLDPVQPLTSSYLRNIGAAEALFKVNSSGKVEPSLAENSKEVDALTWEIKLRSNAHFWSGKAIDAAAVIASLERSKAKDLQALPFLADLTFTRLDDYTIQVKTTSPHVPVPLNLSYYQTVIHNTEAKQAAVDTMDLSGMYKIVEFIPKQKMVAVLNENYWGKKPTIKRVVYEEITDGQTRVLSVLSGKSQLALNIPVTSLAQFKDNKDVRISAAPAANTQTIYLNVSKPQLADSRVRQALSWALDRKELVVLGAEGQSIPVTTWLSSNPEFAEARNAVYPKSDPAKANQLLDEAGWMKGADGIRMKDGNPLSIRLMTWGGDKALGEALQNQWTKLGVKADVQHGDYSLIQAARDKGDWDASIEAWSTFGNTHTLLSGQFSPKGKGNYGVYNDAQTNALLDQLKAAGDDAARHVIAVQINERVAQQAPIIALFPRPQLTAVSKNLTGFEEHFMQFENAVNANLSFGSGIGK
ncbi:ABC transporter substrate-binding protein [Paenibacillus sp. HWE-109]|uniref:ABC transporter substrate-binding protein n=1 Tax=Paenibacillus sp. HWE-109 TaxID=1306526 RepID=UPI001EDEECC7|nr:ABC transporter substrate-binding protein [Paenibacillus sp. HWE-109]UKS29393.1 ABC transporter substrate-binding protein [Paenibacillus sp. HWE-109]